MARGYLTRAAREALAALDFLRADAVLDQLWRRLGIDKALRAVARGRKFDAARMERVLFALAASRALSPSSKLEVTRWVAEDVHIDGLEDLDADLVSFDLDLLRTRLRRR